MRSRHAGHDGYASWQRSASSPQLRLVRWSLEGTDIVRAHQSARMLPASVVWPIAFAAALACYPYARARAGAAAAILVGVAMATLGSIPFLDRFGSDPLLLPAEAMTQVHVSGAPAAEFALPFYAIDVRLSPGGVYLAAHDARRGYGRQNERSSFEIGRLGRQFSSVSAGEVAFLDDEHLLTVRENDEGTEIDDRSLTQLDVPVWRKLVPGLFGASMTLDRQAHRWRLLGWDAEHRILRARGTIGAPDIEITRWASPIDRKSGRRPLASPRITPWWSRHSTTWAASTCSRCGHWPRC